VPILLLPDLFSGGEREWLICAAEALSERAKDDAGAEQSCRNTAEKL